MAESETVTAPLSAASAVVDREYFRVWFHELGREYGLIVALNASTLCGLVALIVIGKDDIHMGWPGAAQHLTAAMIGAMMALSVARMSYVIWRDYDIVKLQKYLIDTLAARDVSDAEAKASGDKITDIRSAGLRKIMVGEPKAWGE